MSAIQELIIEINTEKDSIDDEKRVQEWGFATIFDSNKVIIVGSTLNLIEKHIICCVKLDTIIVMFISFI